MERHRLEFNHMFSIAGQGAFAAATTEEIGATVGEKYIDRNGLSSLPLRVVEMAGGGQTEGVGRTEYWLDKSRPVESIVRAKAPGRDFPAVHEMRFHLLLTTEALPGRTFRSINPAVMANDNATSFPPKLGSRYVLKDVVELEDVNDPGVVVVRVLSNKGEIVGSGRFGFLRPSIDPRQ
jgi:hypothetical protein